MRIQTKVLLTVCAVSLGMVILAWSRVPAHDEVASPTSLSNQAVKMESSDREVASGTTSFSPAQEPATGEIPNVAKEKQLMQAAAAEIPQSVTDSVIDLVDVSKTEEGNHDTVDNRVVVPVQATGTVLSAMYAYTEESSTFSFKGKEYLGIGYYVLAINGREEGGGFYWILHVNDRTANLGVSQQSVGPGDHVEWRFEKGY